MKTLWFSLLFFLGYLGLSGCARFRETDPILPADTARGPMPSIRVAVREDSSIQVRVDSVFPTDVPYTLQFGSLSFGKLVLRPDGKTLEFLATARGWKADSTTYTFCRKGRCRNGWFKVLNLDYRVDTTPQNDTLYLPRRGPFYLNYLGTFEDLFVPTGVNGKIFSISHFFYTALIQEPDSTSILYLAGGGTPGTFGFDDVTYLIRSVEGKVYKGQFEMILGDTCQARARDDRFQLSGTSKTWLPSEWWQNDQPCDGPEANLQVRIGLAPYTNASIATRNGILTDTSIDGQRQLRYQRTNAAAKSDTLLYYLRAGLNNRITRAKVFLQFP